MQINLFETQRAMRILLQQYFIIYQASKAQKVQIIKIFKIIIISLVKKELMNNKPLQSFLGNYQILCSQPLAYKKTSKIYRVVKKQTNQHFVLKILNISQQFHSLIQRGLWQARDLLRQDNKFICCAVPQLFQWLKQGNNFYIIRPFINGNGDSIYNLIMKNQQNPFRIDDFPYFANKYYEVICKSFSTNFFPTLQNIYLEDDKICQNFTSFTGILFLKLKNLISKQQYCEIYPYLKSDWFQKQEKPDREKKKIKNYLQIGCKIRSLLIFLISFMTGQIPRLIQISQISDTKDFQSQIGRMQKQAKQKWKCFLNKKQNLIVFRQYGRLLKNDKQYFNKYFNRVFVEEYDYTDSEFVNQGFFNFPESKINKKKNQYKLKQQHLKDIAKVNAKLDLATLSLFNFMTRNSYSKFGRLYCQQSSQNYIKRQVQLNRDLLNQFQKWYHFCLVDPGYQTQQIIQNKMKLRKKVEEFIQSEQFQNYQKAVILNQKQQTQYQALIKNTFFLKAQLLNAKQLRKFHIERLKIQKKRIKDQLKGQYGQNQIKNITFGESTQPSQESNQTLYKPTKSSGKPNETSDQSTRQSFTNNSILTQLTV